jgi:hypothetical protein
MDKQTDNSIRSRAGRAISELVMAELFLVQATIESASALSDSITELRQNESGEDLTTLLARTRRDVVEPYSTRFKYLRELVSEQKAA